MKCFLLCLIIFGSIAMGQTATAPAAGDGTSGNPYQIASLDNLYWISQNSAEWGKYFIQTVDIDASATSTWTGGAGFPPIGNSTIPFSGSYNGNGKIISGLFINNSVDQWVGLFGYISGASASVASLGLTSMNISASRSGVDYIGGIAGALYGGPLTNCYTTGSISSATGTDVIIGGLVGYYASAGTISKCYSKANVTINATSYAGGLIGSAFTGSIADCYATGNVTVVGGGGANDRIGGLIGTNSINISNCYSSGSVNATNGNVGGLIGINSGTVTNCFWDTQTSGQATSAAGTGKTTAEMKTQTTFTGASWDFTTIWEMIGTNYPRLQSIPDAALPVELTSFTAAVENNNVTLSWTTATEVNNYGFQVERKKEKVKSGWEKIGFVAGSGNSNSPKSYSFTDKPSGGTSFSYKLKQIDNDGHFKYYDAITVSLASSTKAELMQNSPNPFNPSTAIKFYIPDNSDVTIKIYDMLGREVTTLINNQTTAGYHIVYWNGKDIYGRDAASGVYLYRLKAGNFIKTKKMNLLK